MKNHRVVHFEITANDPDRAGRFYSDVFGWKIQKWDGPQPYWLINTGEGTPGINGGIMKRSDPQDRIVNTIEVESVDQFCDTVSQKGGKVTMNKVAVPGVGYMAYCQDTEGNDFGIMQFDKSAK